LLASRTVAALTDEMTMTVTPFAPLTKDVRTGVEAAAAGHAGLLGAGSVAVRFAA
jgi:hypothetical protein